MRVLVLGGTGFIGARLCAALGAAGCTPVAAGRRQGGAPGDGSGRLPALRLDCRDEAALSAALRQVDAAVNCVAGDAASIARGAAALVRAARAAGLRRLVHLSSMAVYGLRAGPVDEATPLTAPAGGWYARAKREAEAALAPLARAGTRVVVLRPGCVWGPGSTLWVERIADLLAAGRLGDLGAGGDGWTNGVQVDDVCRAILAALRTPVVAGGGPRVFNLAAPDSPRWNTYFCDLALAIGATPVARLAPARLRLDAWLAGPPLQLLRRAIGQGPWPVSPGLPGLFARQLQLDASAATQALGLEWTRYAAAVNQGAAWWLARRAGLAGAGWAA